VKYRSGAAFRQALEQRLLTRSRDRGISLVRLRKAVVFDRLLVRLAIVAPSRWVLKGALALDFRLGERTRTTKDMDLVRRDNVADHNVGLSKAPRRRVYRDPRRCGTISLRSGDGEMDDLEYHIGKPKDIERAIV
jgi:hypothetical protein